jgi:hypothetical protein
MGSARCAGSSFEFLIPLSLHTAGRNDIIDSRNTAAGSLLKHQKSRAKCTKMNNKTCLTLQMRFEEEAEEGVFDFEKTDCAA